MEDIQMCNLEIQSRIHDYEVIFIESMEAVLKELLQDGDFIIIDERVHELYKGDLSSIFSESRYIDVKATEENKSYQGVIPIIQRLIDEGFRKNHRLIAIGGGCVQDITAFIASIMYRGVGWFFFPTTLLAQCDSCIGSKTSINFGEYKNQLGGFYPPNRVFINPHFIDTLSEGDIRSGLGEMLHYYIVSGKEDFLYYKENYARVFMERDILSRLIRRSLLIKKKYIEVDEFDQNIRQVFNYGHSFGHAIETLTHYRIPHGIAVSYGMDIANFISMKLGFISMEMRNDIRDIARSFWPGFSIKDIDPDRLINVLGKDKKNVGTRLGLILTKGYGRVFKQIMSSDEQFRSWLREYFEKELNISNYDCR